jgi:hypothetical protein
MADVLDVFKGDAFSMAALTKAINHIDHVPQRIGQLRWFEEEGIASTIVIVEEDHETISLVPVRDRGGVPDPSATDARKARTFRVPHVPTNDKVLADEVLNVRAYAMGGAPSMELLMLQNLVTKKLEKMRRRIEATIEFHRIGALAGSIRDADGTTELLNLFTAFDVSQQTLAMALNTATTNVRGKIREAQRLSHTALRNDPVRGWHALCGDEFYDTLIGHAKVEGLFTAFEDARILREGAQPYGIFQFGGVLWENYRGIVGGVEFIDPEEALLVPTGVPGLMVTYFGPSDYVDRVNQIPDPNGLPIEARQELMPLAKGVLLEAQSNPLPLVTKPRAIINLTIA